MLWDDKTKVYRGIVVLVVTLNMHCISKQNTTQYSAHSYKWMLYSSISWIFCETKFTRIFSFLLYRSICFRSYEGHVERFFELANANILSIIELLRHNCFRNEITFSRFVVWQINFIVSTSMNFVFVWKQNQKQKLCNWMSQIIN